MTILSQFFPKSEEVKPGQKSEFAPKWEAESINFQAAIRKMASNSD